MKPTSNLSHPDSLPSRGGSGRGKLLFITWDSDQTNYLENLFFPIFKGLSQTSGLECHVMQFSWANSREVERIRSIATQQGITYVHHKVLRKPHAALGAYFTMVKGAAQIKAYANENNIQVLMPRSTMPAMMVNRLHGWLKKTQIKTVFDADGLPIEERVDFAGLKQGSMPYKWLKYSENQMLKKADRVITRSQEAIECHLKQVGGSYRQKFFKVSNGRDREKFKPDQKCREEIRSSLGLKTTDILWVYTGSLGPAYRVQEMIELFDRFYGLENTSQFLFLTRNGKDLSGKIPAHLENAIIVKTVPFEEVPCYLAAADLGLSLRQQAPSLAGLAPIKIGEYLLSGVPVIASPGVGDTESMLADQQKCFIYDNLSQADEVFKWISTLKEIDRNTVRELGLQYFDLAQSIMEYQRVVEALSNNKSNLC